ncbi:MULTISPECIES: isoleucyl-tRNA synthetase [Pedobacter]|uniref:isoleucyl-tRNA synthetase n=1 Tax=Pedobacter TaxID=84567 RepID=UPI00210A0439|nr:MULTISPECIES: isoleucyl-tRNA synthetase [unclassified Pedobacter]
MIRILKLQKAVIAYVLGTIAAVIYLFVRTDNGEQGRFLLTVAGICFIAGALMSLYPIFFAKKTRQGLVELDPAKHETVD